MCTAARGCLTNFFSVQFRLKQPIKLVIWEPKKNIYTFKHTHTYIYIHIAYIIYMYIYIYICKYTQIYPAMFGASPSPKPGPFKNSPASLKLQFLAISTARFLFFDSWLKQFLKNHLLYHVYISLIMSWIHFDTSQVLTGVSYRPYGSAESVSFTAKVSSPTSMTLSTVVLRQWIASQHRPRKRHISRLRKDEKKLGMYIYIYIYKYICISTEACIIPILVDGLKKGCLNDFKRICWLTLWDEVDGFTDSISIQIQFSWKPWAPCGLETVMVVKVDQVHQWFEAVGWQ